MPYLHPQDREKFKRSLKQIQQIIGLNDARMSGGNLNYLISSILNLLLEDVWIRDRSITYEDHINTIIGALECTKLEFYRRIAAPHEDKAILRNGDVYSHSIEHLLPKHIV